MNKRDSLLVGWLFVLTLIMAGSLALGLANWFDIDTEGKWSCNQWQTSEFGVNVSKSELQSRVDRFNRNNSHEGWLYAEVEFNSENATVEVSNLSETKIDPLKCGPVSTANESCRLGNHSSFSYKLTTCTEYVKTKTPTDLHKKSGEASE